MKGAWQALAQCLEIDPKTSVIKRVGLGFVNNCRTVLCKDVCDREKIHDTLALDSLNKNFKIIEDGSISFLFSKEVITKS